MSRRRRFTSRDAGEIVLALVGWLMLVFIADLINPDWSGLVIGAGLILGFIALVNRFGR
jgi:hypothetical protein